MEKRIKEISDIYEEKEISNIIENIESCVPSKSKLLCRMSSERKRFIVKVICCRIGKLKELVKDVPKD